jgi:hypothetical protein
MKYVSFNNEEKIKMFDEIAGHFYNANFGQMSKSDSELMMFNFYIKAMIEKNKNHDGTIDYNRCSDYKISKDLGITQQRVRNLKVKNQLINPIDFSWQNAFATLVENACYDSVSKKVTVNIPDPNLYYEIENFIDEHGAYVEKQLNRKILQLRVEYFIDLVLEIEPEVNKKEIIKRLKADFKENNKTEAKFDEKQIGKSLIEGAVNISEILTNVLSLLPQKSASIKIVTALISMVNSLTKQ